MDLPSTLPIQPSAPPSLPMQLGVPLDQLSYLFFGCLIAAIGLVYLFCRQKFNERSITGTDDFVYQLLPRELATNEEYTRGFMTYFGTLAVTVLLLSLIGPKNLATLGIPLPGEIGYVVVPLAIAFLLIGILPTVPGLQEIEKWLRKYAHERAHIPAAALATAQRLSAAEFEFSAYACEAFESPDLQGVLPDDFKQPRRSLEHDWARLSCLIHALKSCRAADVIDSLNVDLLCAYEKDLESIEDKRRSMAVEIAAYRQQKAVNPAHTNEPLRRAIRSNLFKLYILLGCAVRRRRQAQANIDVALRPFGFKLIPAEGTEGNGDLKLVGISFAAISALLLGLAASTLSRFGLWDVSPVFPQELYQPFLDTASALIPHIAAIMIADFLRRRLLKQDAWFGAGRRAKRAIPANYIRVAAMSGIAGYLSLVLWGIALQDATVDGMLIDAPYALLAMATGGFYVFHLDNADAKTRPPRAIEIGSQTLVTALCGLIAASVSLDHIFGMVNVADKIALTTVISGTVGFAFACYFPMAAADARHDPLTTVRDERLHRLESASREHFANPVQAAAWIEAPNPALGNRAPKAAADDVEGFELALSLLAPAQACSA